MADLICIHIYPTVVCSNFGSLFIDYNNNVYSCGKNEFGNFGHEDNQINSLKLIPQLSFIKMISCGRNHSICLDYDGNVFTFGRNNFGQLGIGKTQNEIKMQYIPQRVDIEPILLISCGYDYCICVNYDGDVYSFGSNDKGQLGHKDCKMLSSPKIINELNHIEIIECGAFFVFCKTVDDIIYCWGHSQYGTLGLGDFNTKYIPTICSTLPSNIISMKCGYSHCLFLSSTGIVYSCGSNNSLKLGFELDIKTLSIPKQVPNIPLMQRIEVGSEHSLCIDSNNTLWVFGWNFYGQLGLGHKNIGVSPIKHNFIKDVVDISHGGRHTFVKTSLDKIYAFGYNDDAQYGDGNTKSEKKPIRVFKNNDSIWRSSRRSSRQKSARK